MAVMWLTAMIPQARPPSCNHHSTENCQSSTASQIAILFSCFALISIGGGGISCSLSFGADQLNKKTDPNNQRVLESFISWYIASQAIAVVFSMTAIIYIQDHLGWKLGFGVPAAFMFLSTLLFFLVSSRYVKNKPHSSMLSGFAQVIVVSYKNRNLSLPPKDSVGIYHQNNDSALVAPTDRLRLNLNAIFFFT